MQAISVAPWGKVLFLSALSSLTACTVGSVNDSAGTAVAGAEVVAYAVCGGAGCAESQVVTATPTGELTGYKTSTLDTGKFVYDPYAEVVASEDKMAIRPHNGASSYKLQMSKSGYRDVWIDHTPSFQAVNYLGSERQVDRVQDVYLCGVDELDTDGDDICDAAEAFYGTSALLPDTDGNGVYDDQEIFGSGSPLAVQPRGLLHYNINVSDFDTSKSFYQMLGFHVLLDVSVDVSDPAEAQGLDLPPYNLRAAPMALGKFLIDLIRFNSPFDPEAPHSEEALGLAQLDMETENLGADISLLAANGIEYEIVQGTVSAPSAIRFSDPDGVPIILVQAAGGVNTSPDYKRNVPGPTLYVSDLAQALQFYQKVGFHLRSADAGSAEIYLSNARTVKLVESDSEIPAYEDVNHLGIARMAIETTNIDQDIAILEAAGIEFYTSEAIVPSGPLSFLRYVCFEDPDGTVIELVEYN